MLEVGCGFLVPTAKCFDDEGFEQDPLATAIFEVGAILRRLQHFDGGGWKFGSAMNDGVFSGTEVKAQ